MKQSIRLLKTVAASCLMGILVSGIAHAGQDIYWNNFSGNNPEYFNTAGNWLPATVPGVDDTAWLTNYPPSFHLAWGDLITNRRGVFDLVESGITVSLDNMNWNVSESMTIGNSVSGSSTFMAHSGLWTITNSTGTAELKVNWGTAANARLWFRGGHLIADHIYSSNAFAWAGLDVIDDGTVTTLGDSIFAKYNGSGTYFYIGNHNGANAKWKILGGTNIVEQTLALGATGIYGGGNVGKGTGVVEVAGSNAYLWVKNDITVGGSSEGVGILVVTNGGTARAQGINLGQSGAPGNTVLVTGSNSLLLTTGQIYAYSNQSNNTIRIENGGRWRFESPNGSGQMYFNGDFAPGCGIVVDGPGSIFENWRDIYLGGVGWSPHGRAMILIKNGGVMSTENWAVTSIGGGGGNSRGDLTVTGAGSAFLFGADIYVGTAGTGAVIIADGGLLQCYSLSIGPVGKGSVTNHGGVLQFLSATPPITLAEPGTLVITNGAVSYRNTANANIYDNVSGSSLIKAIFQGHNAFRLCNSATDSNQNYVFDKTPVPTTYARLEMVDGNTHYRGTVSIGSEGSLLLKKTQAVFDNLVTSEGVATLNNATGTFSTAFSNYGRIEGSGALAGPVTSFSGSQIAPGGDSAGTLTFIGQADLQAGTTLELTLNGASNGEFDALAVAAGGTLDIDGVTLTAELGYKPTAGESFLVISRGAGTLTGSLANTGLSATYGNHSYRFSAKKTPEGIVLINVPQGSVIILR